MFKVVTYGIFYCRSCQAQIAVNASRIQFLRYVYDYFIFWRDSAPYAFSIAHKSFLSILEIAHCVLAYGAGKAGSTSEWVIEFWLPRGMPPGRGKFVIDALALPAYVAGISEMQGGTATRAFGRSGKKGSP